MMTNNWIILACALIPAIALLVFVYKQDKRPEPVRLIAKGFLLGVLSVIPISIVEAMLMMAGAGTNMPTTLLGAIFTAFIVAAIPEEGIKLLMLNMLLRRNKFFDEHYDGIVYAVSVSMGFAAVENVSYLFGNVDMWQQVGISRALLQVDQDTHTALKANGYLTRDSRMVERKKYGQKGARRRFQFSKR